MKSQLHTMRAAHVLGATTAAAVSLLMATPSRAGEPMTLEDWTVTARGKMETMKAAFLGFYEEKVYLSNGRSAREFALTDFADDMLARLQTQYQAQRIFTLNTDAYDGTWALSPDVKYTLRGDGFEPIAPGNFEVAGLVTGLTDTQIVKKLTEAGYHFGPFEVTESLDTKWGDEKAYVPKEKRRYVTYRLYAELYRDSEGKPVSDLARIRDGKYEDVRTVQIKFLENAGTEPFHVVGYEIRSAIASYVMNSKDVAAALLANAHEKYGKPRAPGFWERPYGGLDNDVPEILQVSDGILVDNSGLMVRLSRNLEYAEEARKKSTGPVKKLNL